MSDNPFNRLYRRKHFYKVTWTRSEKLLAETPWLKRAQHDFCIVGYRQPTDTEAEKFIGSAMYDRLFDKVISVQEITKEEALRDFQMDNWRSQKVFGANEHRLHKVPLSDQIQSASSRTHNSNPINNLSVMDPSNER